MEVGRVAVGWAKAVTVEGAKGMERVVVVREEVAWADAVRVVVVREEVDLRRLRARLLEVAQHLRASTGSAGRQEWVWRRPVEKAPPGLGRSATAAASASGAVPLPRPARGGALQGGHRTLSGTAGSVAADGKAT